MDNCNELALLMLARQRAYSWFQALLGAEPCADTLAAALSDDALDALAFFAGEEGAAGAFGEALKNVREHQVAWRADPEGFLDAARSAYGVLFVGPDHLPAPPWESCYREGSRALFQATTLEVRKAYFEDGLLPEGYPNVADDHLAIELDYLAALGARASAALEAGDCAHAARALARPDGFRVSHLLKWVPAFACDLDNVPEVHHLFADVVQLLHRFLVLDGDVTGEMLGALGALRGERDGAETDHTEGEPLR